MQLSPRFFGLVILTSWLFPPITAAQSAPPPTPVREVKKEYFGTTVVDPNRWLEKTSDAEVTAWMEAQNDYTQSVLARIPGRDKLLERIRALDNAGINLSALQVWGGRYFTSRRNPAPTIASSLSPDGKWVLALSPGARRALTEIPIGPGESRAISTGEVQVHQAYFFQDAQHILKVGSASGDPGLRIWVQDGENGTPRPISPEGVSFRFRGCISPDGKRLATVDPQGRPTIYNVDGGAPLLVPGVKTATSQPSGRRTEKAFWLGEPAFPIACS